MTKNNHRCSVCEKVKRENDLNMCEAITNAIMESLDAD